MYVKLVLALTVLCVVISRAKSEKSYDGRPFMQQGYTRIKRGKYNSSPKRFYSRPPMSTPIRGPFSYTPPPNYMADDDEPQYPGAPGSHSRPPKVSKRPANDGLGEDDINNIVKYLSKKDLDKIIDLAGGKDRGNDEYSKDDFENFEREIEHTEPHKGGSKSTHGGLQGVNSDKYSLKPVEDDDSSNKLFKALVEQIDIGPEYRTPYQEPKPFSVDYNSQPYQEPKPSRAEYYNKPIQEPNPFNVEHRKPSVHLVTQPTPLQSYFEKSQNNHLYDTASLEAEESMLQKQIAYLKSQINDGVVYTDSKIMPEENLPKPMNLREEPDFDTSYTNNVPAVVRADQSNSYKLENFGDLPLMNYNSKLDTLSSYHVPHYTVTSQSKPSAVPLSSYSAPVPPSYSAPSPYGPKVPSVEPAPPPSVAKAQSDAHLKAVRIWSHKSKGTAYTLHDDGSLSLERPGRPKGSYGYP